MAAPHTDTSLDDALRLRSPAKSPLYWYLACLPVQYIRALDCDCSTFNPNVAFPDVRLLIRQGVCKLCGAFRMCWSDAMTLAKGRRGDICQLRDALNGVCEAVQCLSHRS